MKDKLESLKRHKSNFEQKRTKILKVQKLEQLKRGKLSNEYEQKNYQFIKDKAVKERQRLESVFSFYRERELNYIQRKEEELMTKKVKH